MHPVWPDLWVTLADFRRAVRVPALYPGILETAQRDTGEAAERKRTMSMFESVTPLQALEMVKAHVTASNDQIETQAESLRLLIWRNAELEIENRMLQDRNDELRAELEAFKNDRASWYYQGFIDGISRCRNGDKRHAVPLYRARVPVCRE